MSRKRRMFDIEMPQEETAPAAPDGPRISALGERRSPMASAVRENAEALQARTDHAIDTRNRLFPNLTEMSLSMNSLHGINDGIAAADKSHLGGDASGLGSVPETTR